jgi:hypothetical protein
MINMILLFSFFTGCTTQTNTHHIVGLLDGQEIYDLRITQSDAGILSGQGHIKLHHWQHRTTPLSLGGHFKPKAVEWREDQISMGQAYYSQKQQKFQYVDDGLGALAYFHSLEDGSFRIQGWSTVTNRSRPISGTVLQWKEEYNHLSELLEETYWWVIFGDRNMVVTYKANEEKCHIQNTTIYSCQVQLQEQKVSIDITDKNGAIQNIEYHRKYFYGVEDPHQSLTSIEYFILSPPKRYLYRGITSENHMVVEIYRGEGKRTIKRGKK